MDMADLFTLMESTTKVISKMIPSKAKALFFMVKTGPPMLEIGLIINFMEEVHSTINFLNLFIQDSTIKISTVLEIVGSSMKVYLYISRLIC